MEKRTLNVVTMSVENDAEILGYMGFTDTDTKPQEDGSTICEITHGGYRAEAYSSGDGQIVAVSGPVAPKAMSGIRPDVTIEIRNGHSLAAEAIQVEPRDKWVITSITLGKETFEYPDGNVVDTAMKALRNATHSLRNSKQEFRQASQRARAANKTAKPA